MSFRYDTAVSLFSPMPMEQGVIPLPRICRRGIEGLHLPAAGGTPACPEVDHATFPLKSDGMTTLFPLRSLRVNFGGTSPTRKAASPRRGSPPGDDESRPGSRDHSQKKSPGGFSRHTGLSLPFENPFASGDTLVADPAQRGPGHSLIMALLAAFPRESPPERGLGMRAIFSGSVSFWPIQR